MGEPSRVLADLLEDGQGGFLKVSLLVKELGADSEPDTQCRYDERARLLRGRAWSQSASRRSQKV
jgi:hypothetical protein